MIVNWNNHRRQRMIINPVTVKESNELILLGIAIDNKLVLKNPCFKDALENTLL